MNDRSRVLAAAAVGAVLGGVWGWLYLTANGAEVRERIEPAVGRTLDVVDKAQSLIAAGAASAEPQVAHAVDRQQRHRGDDECPGTAETGHRIGERLAEGCLRFDQRIRVARGAAANERLRRVEPPPEDGHHVHCGMRLPLNQPHDVVPIHFDADALFDGGGRGLVRHLIEQRREPQD